MTYNRYVSAKSDIRWLMLSPESPRKNKLLQLITWVSGVSGGKGERWKRKREIAEGEKRLTQMLLMKPSTPTQHDSIPSNQNQFRSLGCQLHLSKRSPKINLTLRSDNLVPRVLSYPSYGARERPGSLSLLLRRAGRREPWERGWRSDRPPVLVCLVLLRFRFFLKQSRTLWTLS